VDARTATLLEALDPVAVAILVELVAGPATEAELVRALDEGSQPTAHRKLNRLRRAGMLAQEAGKPHAPNRLWTVLHPAETEALLEALFELSEAIDRRAKSRRDAARRKLKRARAARLGIREAGGGKAS
jgi:DNA-binding transcriptional ArsR family regulator